MVVTASYWQREAGWHDRWANAPLPSTVDFAVLGGGLAGLATAIRIRERDDNASIVVLEAERVGFGASGRSAGFLSPLAAPIWLLGAERSADQAWAAARINAEIHAVAAWLGEIAGDAELRPARLSLEAADRISGSALGEFAQRIQHAGLPATRTPRAIAMDAYTMHPYKLVVGLAEHAARLGVTIRERARVRSIVNAPEGARVGIDDGGEVLARRVVLCTNAYTWSVGLDLHLPALVLHSFMTATAPLDEMTSRRLGRDRDAFVVEVNRAQCYYRRHGERLLYGGIDKLVAPKGEQVSDEVRADLRRHMAASFPGVGVDPDQAWTGRFHTTATGLPIITRLASNGAVILNLAYGGTGVALSLACARLAAATACDDDNAATDDNRLLSIIRDTRISVRESMRALVGIARRFAQPWR
ncbi:MAG: FAD-binding oxidoreductase [Deltaproteobacteria bacterium]|nr:FAD-binding oxidoreductase [Deltaproteobacteria bacterium]